VRKLGRGAIVYLSSPYSTSPVNALAESVKDDFPPGLAQPALRALDTSGYTDALVSEALRGAAARGNVPRNIFIVSMLAAFFVGVLNVAPPFRFRRRSGGEIVISEALGLTEREERKAQGVKGTGPALESRIDGVASTQKQRPAQTGIAFIPEVGPARPAGRPTSCAIDP
jgi:hypothetical protein